MNAPHEESLESRIDRLTERVDLLLERQRAFSELVAESGPILTAMVEAGTARFGELEQRGTFAFGRSVLGLLDKVSTSYSPEDVDELGDALVGILDTVRNLTQTDVLEVANDAADVIHASHTLQPVGLMGAMRKSREPDVQRGIAVALAVLESLGKRTDATPGASDKERRLARHLAPSRGVAKRLPAPARRAPVRAATTRAPAPAPASAAKPKAKLDLSVPGYELDADGFLVDRDTWNREFAQAMATQLGLGDLTDEHWTVIETMRADHAENGASPNVRRLAKLSGLGTKAVYQLYKKAPGSTAARIAGVPKPVGCI